MYDFDTVAVTGATSTLGTAVIRECIKNNINVLAFYAPQSINKKRIPVSSFVKQIPCSLDEYEKINIHSMKADIFIHLAWGSTNRSVRNNTLPQVDNVRYSVEAVTMAERLGCKVWIGAGSQAEYGVRNCILHENMITNPVTAYGIAKLCAGQMTRLECNKRNIKHIWPRILSTYGPYTQDTTIINYTINCLLNGKEPALSDCEQIWDFIYVDDAARALLLLADKGKNGEIYNISSGEARKMKEYIEIVHRLVNPKVKINYGAMSGNDGIRHLEADIKKIKELGFWSKITFEEGITKTIEWAKKYYHGEKL